MSEKQELTAEADAILGSLGVAGASGDGGNKKKKKKKKGKPKAEGGACSELEKSANVGETPPQAPGTVKEGEIEEREPDAAAKILAELDIDTSDTKSGKDRKRKKKKGKQKKEEKPKGALSAVGKLAAEHLAKKKEEEEKLKLEEAAEAGKKLHSLLADFKCACLR